MNETILRFGYPATLIAEYSRWLVLLRPAQPTLGSLVLAAKSDATAFSELDADAFAELGAVIASVEHNLGAAVAYEKINYLMLMMVDPHVHFHIIPRYQGERSGGGLSVPDMGWPKAPALADATELTAAQLEMLASWLKSLWR